MAKKGKANKKIEKSNKELINASLLNVISPIGIEFKRNEMAIGENMGKVYGVIKYPQAPSFGWLSRITNIPGTVCSITYKPIDSGIFVDNIARSISRNRGVANSTKDPLTRHEKVENIINRPVIVDPWKREADRTNTNFVIMGVPGVGKSTAIKHIVLSEYMRGTKLIFIDPHREYEELCKNLEGDWINAGGAKEGRINPLQIRTAPTDDDEDNEKASKGMGDMALFINNLEIFFKSYINSLTDRLMAILKSEIIELYNNFNIFWDTEISNLKNTDFPIMEDLYSQIVKKSKIKDNPYIKEYDDLALYLKDLATGSNSFLWNGHTTIETYSQCVCLDTKDLQSTPDNVKSTQYFNMLQWAWDEIVKNPEERVLLVCDEAYLMIDKNNPQSLAFLRNVSKGARKYEGAIAVISHSVVDFLDDEIKAYGQPLLDLATFKIIMGTDGQNLQETAKLYDLTEAEEDLIMSKKRGSALMMIGSKKLQVQFEIPDYKFNFMGKAGGR